MAQFPADISSRSSRTAALALAVFCTACAGAPVGGVTVLDTMGKTSDEQLGSVSEEIAPTGPISLPFRPPDPEGTAYRLLAEITGKRATNTGGRSDQTNSSQSNHLLDLEYREFPMEASEDERGRYLMRLDGLHHVFRGGNPVTTRESELWQDRMMIRQDGEIVLDIKGKARFRALKPRAFLKRNFGVITYDASGNPVVATPSGSPPARKFLADMPVMGAVVYSRFAFPPGPVIQGSQWSSVRYPPGWAHDLGVTVTIHYTVIGFANLDGVPTAVVRLRGDSPREQYPLAKGTSIDGLVVTLNGTAWIDLETSRVRRMTSEDTIKILLSSPGSSGTRTRSRIEQKNRITLELRDPQKKPSTWSNGTRRFGKR